MFCGWRTSLRSEAAKWGKSYESTQSKGFVEGKWWSQRATDRACDAEMGIGQLAEFEDKQSFVIRGTTGKIGHELAYQAFLITRGQDIRD